jgi:Amino acid transporters
VTDASRPALRRDLGTWGAMSIVVGTVIGSGIFLVPKSMILRVGSPEMLFLVWVFGGILSLFGALTYAELAAAFPDAGGEYVYLKEAYGPFFGFLYAWTQTWVAKSASIATLATALFYYLGNFYPGLDKALLTIPWNIGPNGTPFEIRYGQLLAMGIILLLGFLNYFGVRLGGHVQIIITIIKVGLIAGIVVIGLGAGVGTTANYSTSIPAVGGFAGFFAALVAALWAYDGWNNVGMVASEIRNPQRNLPIALIGGTLLVIAIYLAANLAYFYVLSSREVSVSDRVAAEMMRRVLGQNGANAVSVAAMVSIFAALNGSILSGSRVPYAAARDGYFFPSFGNVNEKYRTPGVSLMILCVWSALLVLSGHYEQLYTLVIFPSWILYAMATASVLVLRRTRPDVERPYRTFGYPLVPVLFVLVAVILIFQTLRESPRESLLGLVIIIAGLPFYFHWKRRFSN